MKITITRKYLLIIALISALAESQVLRQQIEISRHGARAPVSSYNPQLWPNGLGQLTPSGQRQHYLIGNSLRNELILSSHFLSQEFNSVQVRVQSTMYNRTIMSAQAQLLGLYPPQASGGPTLDSTQQENAVPPGLTIPDLQDVKARLGADAIVKKTQPIPIHQESGKPDYKLNALDDCQIVRSLLNENMKSQKFNKSQQVYKEIGVTQTLMRVFNLTEELNPQDSNAWSYADDIISTYFQYPGENRYNLTNGEYQNILAFVNNTFYMGMFGTDDIIKLVESTLFLDILAKFNAVIANDLSMHTMRQNCNGNQSCLQQILKNNQENRLKFVYYSTHDTNIASITLFLQNVTKPHLSPPFASTYMFKLYSKATSVDQVTGDPADYFVQVLYQDVVVKVYKQFTHFENMINKRAYTGDIVSACINGIPDDDNNKTQNSGINYFLSVGVPIICAVVVIIVIALVIYFCCCRKMNRLKKLNSLQNSSNWTPNSNLDSTGVKVKRKDINVSTLIEEESEKGETSERATGE